ncbi:hypothetical protein PC128_g20372 [Phytophthora cactorum]|nr:hypothetical protein PC120_g7752 [Phytophthora cactorum]KAG3069306.1 hypothetical protein PC121_g9871 [Phytophthora cactorum]KAG3163487.1 hypothetical protein PC128_g20372 [Phytophthora cactorum]KAG4057567.1 hypothetical protein PC123_g7429 [Phytophthora cactorum]
MREDVALRLLKEALLGIQTWYSYTYCRLADKPGYEVYAIIDMGVAVQTCMSGSITSCMDSALVHGMVFMQARRAVRKWADVSGLRQRHQRVLLHRQHAVGAGGFSRLNWHPSSADSHPENSDQGVYDDYASYVVRGGDMLVQSRTRYSPEWKTEGSGCDSSGLLHFLLPEVYVMDGASTTQSRGAIVLHSSARGDMVGQVTTTGI